MLQHLKLNQLAKMHNVMSLIGFKPCMPSKIFSYTSYIRLYRIMPKTLDRVQEFMLLSDDLTTTMEKS